MGNEEEGSEGGFLECVSGWVGLRVAGMFTGLVEEMGTVEALQRQAGGVAADRAGGGMARIARRGRVLR